MFNTQFLSGEGRYKRITFKNISVAGKGLNKLVNLKRIAQLTPRFYALVNQVHFSYATSGKKRNVKNRSI